MIVLYGLSKTARHPYRPAMIQTWCIHCVYTHDEFNTNESIFVCANHKGVDDNALHLWHQITMATEQRIYERLTRKEDAVNWDKCVCMQRNDNADQFTVQIMVFIEPCCRLYSVYASERYCHASTLLNAVTVPLTVRLRGVGRNLFRRGTKEWVPSPAGYRAPGGVLGKAPETWKLCWKFDWMSKIPYWSGKKFSAWQFRRGTCLTCLPFPTPRSVYPSVCHVAL